LEGLIHVTPRARGVPAHGRSSRGPTNARRALPRSAAGGRAHLVAAGSLAGGAPPTGWLCEGGPGSARRKQPGRRRTQRCRSRQVRAPKHGERGEGSENERNRRCRARGSFTRGAGPYLVQTATCTAADPALRVHTRAPRPHASCHLLLRMRRRNRLPRAGWPCASKAL
jgi:hypothetical protein